MAGAEDRVGICAQDGSNSPTIGHGDQGGSWSCSSGWRGLLFVVRQFGLLHIFGEGVCVLVAISGLSLLKEELMKYVSVRSTGMWCRNSRLSLSLLGAAMGRGHRWCPAMQSIELGVQIRLIKGQESSEMVVCPSLQHAFGSLLKPRKE